MDIACTGTTGSNTANFYARKEAISDAIKALVRQGLLQVDLKDGFRYSATDNGIQCYAGMQSNYAVEYREQLRLILERYSDYSESELQKLIRMKAIKDD